MAIADGRPAGYAALVQDHGEWPLAESSADTVAKASFIQFQRPDALATFGGRRVYVSPPSGRGAGVDARSGAGGC